ncbi:MAG: hypothetical protein Q4D02_00110 [Clostridia bacterium]|nr:hypothetical protein [Clostridia bacterium]
MEESAFDAIYIGIYVFVFVIAVTATMFLYNSISDYADLAYEFSHKIESSGIIEGSEVSRNKIITGEEVINYYYNYIKRDKYDSSNANNSNYIVNINLNGKGETENLITSTNLTYRELIQKIGISNKYLVEYTKETSDGKAIINITRVTSTTDENGDTLEDQLW